MKPFQRTKLLGLPLLFAALFVLAFPRLQAEQVKDLPKPTDYVSDFAHALSPQAVAELDNLCSQLDHSKANSQIAIVIVRDLDGDDAADWANQLEEAWKIGKKGSDKGVLVLLAVSAHKYRIDVGYGLEGILNDAKLGDIGREMVPYLRSRDYDGAVTMAVGQVAQTIAADAGVTLTLSEDQPQPRARVQHHSSALPFILFVIIFLFFGGFTLLRFLFFLGLFGGGFRGGPWMGGGGGWGGGGGGFGGGGGGDSGGGGGFGGFGGGDFGGGGAGGDW